MDVEAGKANMFDKDLIDESVRGTLPLFKLRSTKIEISGACLPFQYLRQYKLVLSVASTQLMLP